MVGIFAGLQEARVHGMATVMICVGALGIIQGIGCYATLAVKAVRRAEEQERKEAVANPSRAVRSRP